jgi:hypothetical protein
MPNLTSDEFSAIKYWFDTHGFNDLQWNTFITLLEKCQIAENDDDLNSRLFPYFKAKLQYAIDELTVAEDDSNFDWVDQVQVYNLLIHRNWPHALAKIWKLDSDPQCTILCDIEESNPDEDLAWFNYRQFDNF